MEFEKVKELLTKDGFLSLIKEEVRNSKFANNVSKIAQWLSVTKNRDLPRGQKAASNAVEKITEWGEVYFMNQLNKNEEEWLQFMRDNITPSEFMAYVHLKWHFYLIMIMYCQSVHI